MKQNIWSAAVIGLCAILTAAVLGGAYKHKYGSQNRIVVTGLGERQFTSDLIVWKGWIVEQAPAIESGYAALEANKRKVQEYLRSRGIADSAVLFMFVNVNRQTEPVYQDGRYVGDRFTGYELRQEFRIESTDVEAVESVSREISSLIADARARAEIIARNASSSLGRLANGRMGVFQITGANSNEALSAGGNYNSASKNKKASITMRLEYITK